MARHRLSMQEREAAALDAVRRLGYVTIRRYADGGRDYEGSTAAPRSVCDRLTSAGRLDRDYFRDRHGSHWTIYAEPGALRLPAWAVERAEAPR